MGMSFHRHSRGRSVARCLHCLSIYQEGSFLVDDMIFGNNTVSYGHDGPHIATITWDGDTDNPTFVFHPENCKDYLKSNVERFRDRQFYLKPFIDDDEVQAQSTGYIIQQVRNCLKFEEATRIIKIRDCKEGDWGHLNDDTIQKIKTEINEALHGRVVHRLNTLWRHFALCAVHKIQINSERPKLGWLAPSRRILQRISLNEAMMIAFVRDQWEGDWTRIVDGERVVDHLQSLALEVAEKDEPVLDWKQLALGAIANYDFIRES